MKKILSASLFLLGFLVLVSSKGFAATYESTWQTAAVFKTPESVVFDKRTGLLFVSNINGAPNERDGNGFISTVSTDGDVIQLEWVGNLSAPKGLTVVGKKLYVSDINQLVEIDIDRGKILKRYQGAGAQFLNDVVADQKGNVYVSDMATNIIYRLNEGVFEPWLSGEQLENPNGLLVQGDKMVIASWGKMTDGFNTKVPGHLKIVSLKDKSLSSLGDASPTGNLDGLTSDGNGGYYVTDWMKGGLLQINSSGESAEVIGLNQGSADHAYIEESKLLLIPMMMDGYLLAYTVR